MVIQLIGFASKTLLPELEASGIKFELHRPPVGVVMNSADTILLLKKIGEIVGPLSLVLVTWLKSRAKNAKETRRSINITTINNVVVFLDGKATQEVESLLPQAKAIMVVEGTKPKLGPVPRAAKKRKP